MTQVTYTSRDLLSIASLTASLQVDGHRPDLVILKAARAQAAFEGRTAITDRDIALAAELALPHRIKRGPFQQANRRWKTCRNGSNSSRASHPGRAARAKPLRKPRNAQAKKKVTDGEGRAKTDQQAPDRTRPQNIFDQSNSQLVGRRQTGQDGRSPLRRAAWTPLSIK